MLLILLNPTAYNGASGAMRYEIYPAKCHGYSSPVGHCLKEYRVSGLQWWQECRDSSHSEFDYDRLQKALSRPSTFRSTCPIAQGHRSCIDSTGRVENDTRW